METKQTYLANLIFSETLIGTPDNLQNFKFLKLRIYEIGG